MFSLNKLIAAYHSCRQRKQRTVNALAFKHRLFEHTASLFLQLNNRSYEPGRSICFAVKYPKLREIFAADFRDRVVHHLLVKELEPRWEKTFIFDSYACRLNKGGHLAVKRLQQFLRQLTGNFTQLCFYQQLDLSNFFARIDKGILKDFLEQHINHFYAHQISKKQKLLWLSTKIIDHDPTQNYHLNGSKSLHAKVPHQKSLFHQPSYKGLPIGNLTSQFFANVYLNHLDQFCKRRLKIKHYLRYADDFVMLSQNKAQLIDWRKQIQDFLMKELKLEINPTKTKLDSIYAGIDFVGYIVKPHCVLMRNKTKEQLKTLICYFNQGFLWTNTNKEQEAIALGRHPTAKQLEYLLAALNSYYGHLKKANTYTLRKHLYQNHFGKLKKYFKPINDYQYFNLR